MSHTALRVTRVMMAPMSAVPSGRNTAQQRTDRILAFRAEVQALQAEGLEPFAADSERRIATHHDALLSQYAARFDVDVSDAAGRLSRGMQLASFFAALTLSATVYSLVARFWSELDLPLQIALLTLVPILALAGVDLAARRQRSLYIASVFAAAAYAAFWLATVRAVRLLDLPLSPAVLWMGVVFGLSLALGYGFRVVLVAALAALIAALAGTFFSIAGAPWTTAGSQLEPATVAALGLLGLAPGLEAAVKGFGPVTRRVALVAGLGALLALSLNGELSLWPLPSRWLEGGYQVVTLVACLIAIVVGLRRRLPDVAAIASTALVLFLGTRYVDWFWPMLPRFVFFLVLAIAAFGWLLALRRVRARLEDR